MSSLTSWVAERLPPAERAEAEQHADWINQNHVPEVLNHWLKQGLGCGIFPVVQFVLWRSKRSYLLQGAYKWFSPPPDNHFEFFSFVDKERVSYTNCDVQAVRLLEPAGIRQWDFMARVKAFGVQACLTKLDQLCRPYSELVDTIQPLPGKLTNMSSPSWFDCGHANEVPYGRCECPGGCICRIEGSCSPHPPFDHGPTQLIRNLPPKPAPILTRPERRPGQVRRKMILED